MKRERESEGLREVEVRLNRGRANCSDHGGQNVNYSNVTIVKVPVPVAIEKRKKISCIRHFMQEFLILMGVGYIYIVN